MKTHKELETESDEIKAQINALMDKHSNDMQSIDIKKFSLQQAHAVELKRLTQKLEEIEKEKAN